MSSKFVGTWMCQFYTWDSDSIVPTPPFPLTIEQKSKAVLRGSYPIREHPEHPDATLEGPLTNDGSVWAGTFKGKLEGTFVFVLGKDGHDFHGAWVLDGREGPPQPWWGYRERSTSK
jgi:hypothetical protein